MSEKMEVPAGALFLLRKNWGLSRLELSRRSGIGYTSLTSLEHQRDTRIKTVCTAAIFFDVPVDSLYEVNESMVDNSMGSASEAVRSWLQGETLGTQEITGLEYLRRKRRMSQRELAARSEVHEVTIQNIERKGIGKRASSSQLYKIARALSATVDELFMYHSGSELDAGDRGSVHAKSRNPQNALDNYRCRNNLTYREMAKRLGLSCQGAIDVCNRKMIKPKYLFRICEYENISTEEFEMKYSVLTDGVRLY